MDLTRVIEKAHYSPDQPCRAELAVGGGGAWFAHIGGLAAGWMSILTLRDRGHPLLGPRRVLDWSDRRSFRAGFTPK